MPFKKYENDEEELLDLGRRFFDRLETKPKYDPVRARAYYQKNRDKILEMNKRYYANHRTEYVEYLKRYCRDNRELHYKRDKLRSVVQNKAIEKEVDNEVQTFVNEIVQPEPVQPPMADTFPLRQDEWAGKRPGRPKRGAKPKKPYTYVRQEGPFIMQFD
jgi:hypothetical protein